MPRIKRANEFTCRGCLEMFIGPSDKKFCGQCARIWFWSGGKRQMRSLFEKTHRKCQGCGDALPISRWFNCRFCVPAGREAYVSSKERLEALLNECPKQASQ